MLSILSALNVGGTTFCKQTMYHASTEHILQVSQIRYMYLMDVKFTEDETRSVKIKDKDAYT